MNETTSTPSSPKAVKTKKRRARGFNVLIILIAIGSIALFVWSEQQRRDALGKLEQTAKELDEIRTVSQRNSTEATQEVLDKVTKLIKINLDPRPTVATITDINALRDTNVFYQKAENGDNLIITPNRAILYDPDENIILDVVPVQIETNQPPAQTTETPSAEAPAGSQSPEPDGQTNSDQVTPSS